MFRATVPPVAESVPVESTSLAWVRYCPDLYQLEVCFHDGDVYRFYDVPPDSYHELLAAPSKGSYFNRNIRKRFRFKRLREEGRIK